MYVWCFTLNLEKKKEKSNAQSQISTVDGALPEPYILQVYKKLYIKPTNYSGPHLNIQMPQNNNNNNKNKQKTPNTKRNLTSTKHTPPSHVTNDVYL